jgi:predicted regulator of Ras-like GTPase activity (Roadblock/LC7/MglB family)
MNVNEAMSAALKNVPKTVATGLVDMESGLLLDIKTTSSHPQEVFDLLAAATKDLFEGENVTAIEDLFKKARGVKSKERYFQEMIIFSKNLIHYFARLDSRNSTVFNVVTQADANIGLVLLKAREIAKQIEV